MMMQEPEYGQDSTPVKPAFTRNPDLYVNIPAELKSLPQWVLWKCELVNGRWSKVPYSPVTGYKASVTNPGQWGGFELVERKIRESYEYDGIGFVFTANDPYVGIDLDNKQNNLAIRDEICALAGRFASYREYSPSRTGYHIIMRGSIPAPLKKGMVEIYSTARYFTVTGDVI